MRQMILADEINRTSPKTQAALLEAMAEGQVSVDGQVYALPEPFMVIATQNPVEFLGTYPLPEAQMDRFMMRLTIGYPDAGEELHMARNFLSGVKIADLGPVCSGEEIVALKEKVKDVHISDAVLGYMQEIIDATRHENRFVMGASPRAFLSLASASRARAFLAGETFVRPDDVKAVVLQVLRHRLILTSDAKIGKEDTDSIIKGLVVKIKIPME